MSRGNAMSPGHAMKSHTSVDPGASGFSPGDRKNDARTRASMRGASEYSRGDMMNDYRN